MATATEANYPKPDPTKMYGLLHDMDGEPIETEEESDFFANSICGDCGLHFFQDWKVLSARESRNQNSFCSSTCLNSSKSKRLGESSRNWHGGRIVDGHGYILIRANGHPKAINGYVPEHTLIAERALGRPLPAGALVHHVNEDRSANFNSNLVICQDRAYHAIIHARMRVVQAGGHPSIHRICCSCHRIRLKGHFGPAASRWDGRRSQCNECRRGKYEHPN